MVNPDDKARAAPQNMRTTDPAMRLAPSEYIRGCHLMRRRYSTVRGRSDGNDASWPIMTLPTWEHRIKDLFFFHLIENGLYVAPRGCLRLNLSVTEEDMAHLESVGAGLIERHRTLLPASQ